MSTPRPKKPRGLSPSQCKAAERMLDSQLRDLRYTLYDTYKESRGVAAEALMLKHVPVDLSAQLHRVEAALRKAHRACKLAQEIAKIHRITVTYLDHFATMTDQHASCEWPTMDKDVQDWFTKHNIRQEKAALQILSGIRTYFEWVLLEDTLVNGDRVLRVLANLPTVATLMDARVSDGDILAAIKKEAE